MQIEVSNGEIVDKLCILEIKLKKIKDHHKLIHIIKEHKILDEAVSKFFSKKNILYLQLLHINQQLWDIEDKCREFEKLQQFDKEFIETARSVYLLNDKRASLKKEINIYTKSDLVEEKSYQ